MITQLALGEFSTCVFSPKTLLSSLNNDFSRTTKTKGKTNHGQTLYGRATRHRDVCLCCIGAIAFYLMFRFDATKEFEDFTLADWSDNSKWFDIKLLVDIAGTNKKKPMKNRSYADAIKSILMGLGITAMHLVHLGRNLGAKILEMLEEESRWIQIIGNWNPSMQEASYSTKLPMKPIRKLAGFSDSNGMYYNPRTVEEVDMALLRLTPVGKWVYKAHAEMEAAIANGATKWTAFNFLSFMIELNKVFIQDSAAILILHPERGDHPLFRMAVFRSEAFAVSMLHCLLSALSMLIVDERKLTSRFVFPSEL
jgi:hypothetical protein